MKRALISPEEGNRIAQIEAEDFEVFEVAEPLHWVEVPDDTTTLDTWDGSRVVKHVAPAVPKTSDAHGFAQALKAAMGGVVAANALAKAYPLFYPALTESNWADLQALIADAHATSVLTDQQYAAFKMLAQQHNIPLTLP